MPQATDEQRAAMATYFKYGGIDLHEPLEFLKENGWIDDNGWLIAPGPVGDISDKEFDCVYFLCDEWDFAFAGCP